MDNEPLHSNFRHGQHVGTAELPMVGSPWLGHRFASNKPLPHPSDCLLQVDMAEDNANNVPAAPAAPHRDRNARFQAGDHDYSRRALTLVTYQLGNFTRK